MLIFSGSKVANQPAWDPWKIICQILLREKIYIPVILGSLNQKTANWAAIKSILKTQMKSSNAILKAILMFDLAIIFNIR